MSDAVLHRATHQFGDYELLERIGQGGMSSVHKARDLRTDEIVAIKIASCRVMSDQLLSRRFELEFALTHPLDHRNLVKVLDNGRTDRVAYLVMEFVDGPTLAQHLRIHERLSENDALDIILQVAEALIYLHKARIIHRDVKPANILLTSRGEAKLTDLGLVKNLESMSRLTRSNVGLGTLQFAAPEQFDDARSADVRSDIYSLAATLYRMVTGEYPFGKGPMQNVVSRKLQNEFDAPISKVPLLSPSVDAAIRLGLHADRESRPASVSEFVAILSGDKKVSCAPADLPGIILIAPAKSRTNKTSDADRRRSYRHAVELEARCRPVVNPVGQRWPAWIIDISTTGLCMHAQRRFEAGSVLEVTFAMAPDDRPINKVSRVRWTRPTETKSWLLGCEFLDAIAEDDFNTMVVDRMDKTT